MRGLSDEHESDGFLLPGLVALESSFTYSSKYF